MKHCSIKEFNEITELLGGYILDGCCHNEDENFQIDESPEFTESLKQLRIAVLKFEKETGFKIKIGHESGVLT